MLHMIACLLLTLVCTRVHCQTSLAFGSSLYSYTTYKGCVVRYSNATDDVIAVPDEITQDNTITALIVVENGPVSGKIVSPRGTILNFLIEPSQISFFRDSSSATSATIYTSTPLFWLNNQVIYVYISKKSSLTCVSFCCCLVWHTDARRCDRGMAIHQHICRNCMDRIWSYTSLRRHRCAEGRTEGLSLCPRNCGLV